MTVLIRSAGVAGLCEPHPTDGQFLKRYDPEYADGLGRAWWTPHEAEALRFVNAVDALALWRSSPASRPLRDDGLPNRPLTAYSVELVTIRDGDATQESV